MGKSILRRAICKNPRAAWVAEAARAGLMATGNRPFLGEELITMEASVKVSEAISLPALC